MKEENKSVNLQNLNQIPLPNYKKKKLKIFLYGSALATTILAGFHIMEQNYLEGAIILGCSSGLWALSNSIHTNDKKYVKRLNIYQKCSILSSVSFLLNGILKPEEINLTVNLFCAGNMLLLHREFTKEKKYYALSKKSNITQISDQK